MNEDHSREAKEELRQDMLNLIQSIIDQWIAQSDDEELKGAQAQYSEHFNEFAQNIQ